MSKNITRAGLIALGVITMLAAPLALPMQQSMVTPKTQQTTDLVEMSKQGGEATILKLSVQAGDKADACLIEVDLEGTKVEITDSIDYCKTHKAGDIIKF